MTNSLTCDNLKFMDAEQSNFDASVVRILCEMRNDLNEREE